ncbi:hypothetical protein H6G17_31080 [Chroococcidiopsis sp. FACHB-1243]|uniref:hypothetical protein n=1 Tax=Chroococcidiopsis sp. [FACHB-1243] TaxID=2692781 RepID=UPI00177E5EF4|nr:hypothetical protein [Chroococcidiopsis sp. [FACHB-1243]]MBD2309859.1 hypothetical protein [Chroococcidiopsis sp. [FACHB-1243]]
MSSSELKFIAALIEFLVGCYIGYTTVKTFLTPEAGLFVGAAIGGIAGVSVMAAIRLSYWLRLK